MDMVDPLPFVTIAPGYLVRLHDPAGKSPSVTDPVAIAQVGCTILIDVGAAGTVGWGEMLIIPPGMDMHPFAVTVNVYEPLSSPVTVNDGPDPVIEIFPGFLVSIHVPVEGSPLRTTVPVDILHEGCVTVPDTGADVIWFTSSVKVDVAAEQGSPNGLFVVRVMVIVRPRSTAAGV
jgi:hypothetical protein